MPTLEFTLIITVLTFLGITTPPPPIFFLIAKSGFEVCEL